MTNVVKFPGVNVVTSPAVPETVQPVKKENSPVLLKFVWVVVVLLWPILKWVMSIDCVVQLLRTMYYWNTAGVHAGWTFILHFAALTALTFFVSAYKPKGL
ncbi:MAG: KleE stable inheritance protein [Telluria sp.]